MYILDIEHIKQAKITLTLIFINIFSFIVFNLILPYKVFFRYVQINYFIINKHEYWRLFTAMFLHADVMHLFSNMIALLIFGAVVENNYKRSQYAIIYFISGLIGNLFSLLLLPIKSMSLGASGAIFGLIGASFILFVMEGDKTILFLAIIYLAYFVISSFAPNINLWAHLFGLIGGVLFGYLLYKKKYIIEDEYD